MSKNGIFTPNGITEEMDENSFTSPPPHTFNCHNSKVIVYVIDHEIIEKKINLTLPVMIVRIRFDEKPKASKRLFSLLGTTPVLIS